MLVLGEGLHVQACMHAYGGQNSFAESVSSTLIRVLFGDRASVNRLVQQVSFTVCAIAQTKDTIFIFYFFLGGEL